MYYDIFWILFLWLAVYNLSALQCLLWLVSGETCIANSQATNPFEWWRSSDRCLLGTLLSFRWSEWQNSSCHWGWCLPTTSGASTVNSIYTVISLVFISRLAAYLLAYCIISAVTCFFFFASAYCLHVLVSTIVQLGVLTWQCLIMPVIHLLQFWYLPFGQWEILLLAMMLRLRYFPCFYICCLVASSEFDVVLSLYEVSKFLNKFPSFL